MQSKLRWMTETALLAALITITGAIKLPGPLPGTEFQLSAPLAVAICAAFGFVKYITAGLLSSLIGLILGTQTILNVCIALVFRLSVGAILAVCGTAWPFVIIAGPIGSALARLALSGLLGKAVIPLLIAAVPGMVYTALGVWPLTKILRKVKDQTEKVFTHVVQR